MLLLFLTSLAWSAEAAETTLDLQGWEGQVTPLDGEWLFLPGSLDPRWNNEALPESAAPLMVPGDWDAVQPSMGAGTYTTTLRLSEAPQEVVFWLKYAGSAYRLTLDGEPLLARGMPGLTLEDTEASWGPARTHRILSGEHTLVLQVANHHRLPGGLQNSIHVGSPDAMEGWLLRRDLLNFFMFGGLSLMGGYHMTLWLLRREERSSFWFALFCAVAVVRRLSMENMPWRMGLDPTGEATMRISLLTLCSFPALGISYMEAHFPSATLRKLITLSAALFVLLAIPITLAPMSQVSLLMGPIQGMILLTLVTVVLKGVQDLRARAPMALSFYGGLSPLFLGAIHDILVYNHLVPWEMRLSPVGLLIWFLIQVMMLLRRNVDAHRTANHMNELLTQAVEERTRELRGALQSAQEAARAKTQFMANVSHEVRTPMNGVMGTAHLLSRTTLSAEQKGYVSTILQSGEVVTTVLNDVLDISKLASGQVTLEHRPFKPATVVQWAEALFGNRATQRGLELLVSIPPDLPPMVGDATRLRQVLANLVNNALKFTEVGQVQIRLTEDSRTGSMSVLRFEVQDTGIGVPVDQVEVLFTPFAQANNSTTRAFGGSGLGLSICHQLVNLMGGQIGVNSRQAGPEGPSGSTFWFICPMPLGTADEAREAAMLHGRRLLVVEDNLVNQRIILKMLATMGAEATLATQGAEGVASFQEEGPFDAVLMDCQMPVMDGFEATRRIRSLPGGDLPILAVTASALEDDRRRVLAAGMDDIVAKPLDLDLLQEAITTALEERQRMQV